ncbi:MAG: hypothetical protein Q8P24_13600 [Desulfobacterales bacterium]|nr:hypothetical protein [Desulfobacterales bacterium]
MRWRLCVLFWASVVLAGSLVAGLHGRHLQNTIELRPDSLKYHFLAANLLLGKGYVDHPVMAISLYGEPTEKYYSALTPQPEKKGTFARTPIYPLFLALIYWIHGIDPDVVQYYQLGLEFILGGAMVWIATLILGDAGLLAGVVAAYLYGMNQDLAYPAGRLLTECLASFWIVVIALLCPYIKTNRPFFESLAGAAMGLATLTRPALVFLAPAYMLFFIPWKKSLIGTEFRRLAWFFLSFLFIVACWSLYASISSGRFILLSTMGQAPIYVGIDPVRVAIHEGLPVPAIDKESLGKFWCCVFTGHFDGNGREIIHNIPFRLSEVFKIMVIKVRNGFDWMPRGLAMTIFLGAAFFFQTMVIKSSTGPAPGSLPDTTLHKLACGAVTLVLALWILGHSHPVFLSLFLLSCMAIAGFGRPIHIVSGRALSLPVGVRGYMSFFLVGYLLTILTTLSIPRFIYPFMPIFYIYASSSIVLLGLALRNMVTIWKKQQSLSAPARPD